MLATHFWMQLQRLSVCLSLCLVGAFIDSVRGKFSPYWKTELLARNAMNNFHNEGLLGSRSQALIYSRTYIGTPCVLFLCKEIFDLWWYSRTYPMVGKIRMKMVSSLPTHKYVFLLVFGICEHYSYQSVSHYSSYMGRVDWMCTHFVLKRERKRNVNYYNNYNIFKNQFKDWVIIIN